MITAVLYDVHACKINVCSSPKIAGFFSRNRRHFRLTHIVVGIHDLLLYVGPVVPGKIQVLQILMELIYLKPIGNGKKVPFSGLVGALNLLFQE